MSTGDNEGTAVKFGFWVIRRRWGVLLVSLVLVAASASGLRFLAFSTDYRDFFEENNPYLRAFENLGRLYTYNDNVFFALAPENGRMFTRENLAVLEDVTNKAWLTPYSTRVDSLANFPHTTANGDDLAVKILTKNPQNLSDSQIGQIEKIALSDTQTVHRFVSASGKVAGVFVNIYLPGKKPTELDEVATYVRKLADDIRREHPEFRVYLGGSVMFSDVLIEASKYDLQKVLPGMYAVVALVLVAALRSFWPVVIALLTIVLAVASAFGLGGWMGIPVSAISANAPTLILTVAVANNIHILVAFLNAMRAGREKRQAIAESLGINMMPILVNNVAAAIGFSSLMFNATPPFKAMGVIVILGLGAAFLLSVFFIPAMLSALPILVKPRTSVRQFVIDRLGDFIVARHKLLFWCMLALVLALASQIERLELNEKFSEYLDKRFAFRADTDFIVKNFTGFGAIEYSLSSGEKNGIARPDYLGVLDRFSAWYGKQPEVVFVNSISETFKRINRTMHGDDESFYRIPEGRRLAAQYLILYEMSLPAGFDLDTQIRYDESASRFTVVLKDITNAELLDLEDRAQKWLVKNAPSGMFERGTGPMILFAHLARDSARNMLSGGILTLVLISLLLIAPLRSLKYGLISLVPNLAPSVMAYGLWGLLDKPLGLAGAVIATMSLGIVVNDNVHFLCEYVRARRDEKLSSEDAARFALRVAGVPMWSASIILVAGFAMLSLSGFTVNSTMGVMTAITIAFAIAADFFFLPPLLLKVEGWTHEKKAVS